MQAVAAVDSRDEAQTLRGRQRYRQAALTTAAGVLAKGAGLASTLVTIPITAPYLGPERFGLFMTVSSIPWLLMFTDFGIGNGLLTELASAHGREDRERTRVLVASAFFMLLGITAVLLAVAAPVMLLTPWDRLLKLQSGLAQVEVMPSLAVFVLLTLVAIPLGVAQRIQQAGQRGFISNLWLFGGNVLSMGLLILCVKFGKSLPWLVASVAISNVVTGALNWLVEFGGRGRWLRPHWRDFDREEATRVAKAGLMIFSSQVGASFLMAAPVILLGLKFGQDRVGAYAIAQRLLSIFVVIVYLLVTPLWPAYGEALARGDLAWIRTAYRRSLAITAVVAGIPLALAWLLAPKLVNLFSSHSVEASRAMSAAVAALCFCVAMRHTICMMVNGCGYLRRTAAGFPAAMAFAAAVLLVPSGFLPPYAIPLWVAAAELLVIAVLLTDAARILAHVQERA